MMNHSIRRGLWFAVFLTTVLGFQSAAQAVMVNTRISDTNGDFFDGTLKVGVVVCDDNGPIWSNDGTGDCEGANPDSIDLTANNGYLSFDLEDSDLFSDPFSPELALGADSVKLTLYISSDNGDTFDQINTTLGEVPQATASKYIKGSGILYSSDDLLLKSDGLPVTSLVGKVSSDTQIDYGAGITLKTEDTEQDFTISAEKIGADASALPSIIYDVSDSMWKLTNDGSAPVKIMTGDVGGLADDSVDNALTIAGGTINSTPIGGTTPGSGVFTTLGAKTNVFLEDPGVGTFKATLTAPTLAANYTLTLPVDDGNNGQVLTTNGSGVLTWSTVSGGSSALATGKIFIGDNSNAAVGQTMSGDVTINTSGLTTISANAVTGSEITDDSVGSSDITDNSITVSDLANGSVDGTKLNASVAGNGLSGAGGSSLAVNPGSGLTITSDALSLSALTSDWNQTGAFDLVLNNSGSELVIRDSNDTHNGKLDVGNLVQDTTYILPPTTSASVTLATSEDLSGFQTSTLADGKIFIGNGSNVAAAQTMSGDATISNAGVLTVANNAIGSNEVTNNSLTESDINASVAGSGLIGGGGTALSVNPGNGTVISGDTIALGNLSGNWTQAGAFDIVLDDPSAELLIKDSDGTNYAKLDVGNLSGDKIFVLPSIAGASANLVTSEDLAGYQSTSLADGKILIGDGTGHAAAQTLSGDASVTNGGVLTIGSDAVGTAEVTDSSLTGSDLNGSVAGNGLVGGAGSALAVGAGTGILAGANDVAVDQTYGFNFTGAIGFGNDVNMTFDGTDNDNLVVVGTFTGTPNNAAISVTTFTNNTSGNNQQIAKFVNNDGSGTTENGMLIVNNDPDTVMGSGLSITSNTGGITTALDLSGANITTGLALGNNSVTVGGATISSTEFSLLDGKTVLGDGDITGITAGNGLTGDAASGTPTLAVGAGSGILANANDVAVDQTFAFNFTNNITFTGAVQGAPNLDLIGGSVGGGNGSVNLSPSGTGDLNINLDGDSTFSMNDVGGALTTTGAIFNFASSGTTTDNVSGINLLFKQSDDADGTDKNIGLNIGLTSSSGDADQLTGISITNSAAGPSSEKAIVIGPNFDTAIDSGGSIAMNNNNINGVGTIGATTANITNLGASSLSSALNANNQVITNINVDSGNIDGTPIGVNSASAVKTATLSVGFEQTYDIQQVNVNGAGDCNTGLQLNINRSIVVLSNSGAGQNCVVIQESPTPQLGHIVTIYVNDGDSTIDIKRVPSVVETTTGADITLSNHQAITFIYDGSQWFQLDQI